MVTATKSSGGLGLAGSVDLPRLVTAYYALRPDPEDPAQAVEFGTSGHRGSSLDSRFNETHVLAIVQAICDVRKRERVNGPLFMGRDTHGLSESAFVSALEVLVANGVDVHIDASDGYTPTPAISRAILSFNSRAGAAADGIVITPSHNPPRDGGIKYNPPHGGPAESRISSDIADRANEYIRSRLAGVRRTVYETARREASRIDFVGNYVRDLPTVVDMDLIRSGGLRIGVDPLGGASGAYWTVLAEEFGLDLVVLNPGIDPTFAHIAPDADGQIRMDCSSAPVMASVVAASPDFDICFGNDPDADRHGIVTRDAGLVNPNHYLSVASDYVLRVARPNWPAAARIGKTIVSTSMIDRVASSLGREVYEVPVGFKWFAQPLLEGSVGLAVEESAGASLIDFVGRPWTTDKDGIVMALLAAEIQAATDESVSERYAALEAQHGRVCYSRVSAAATRAQQVRLKRLSPDDITLSRLAGEQIVSIESRARGNGESIGGIRVSTESSWFAARPSGTEDIYMIYGESFGGQTHLNRVLEDAREMIAGVLQTVTE